MLHRIFRKEPPSLCTSYGSSPEGGERGERYIAVHIWYASFDMLAFISVFLRLFVFVFVFEEFNRLVFLHCIVHEQDAGTKL